MLLITQGIGAYCSSSRVLETRGTDPSNPSNPSNHTKDMASSAEPPSMQSMTISSLVRRLATPARPRLVKYYNGSRPLFVKSSSSAFIPPTSASSSQRGRLPGACRPLATSMPHLLFVACQCSTCLLLVHRTPPRLGVKFPWC